MTPDQQMIHAMANMESKFTTGMIVYYILMAIPAILSAFWITKACMSLCRWLDAKTANEKMKNSFAIEDQTTRRSPARPDDSKYAPKV